MAIDKLRIKSVNASGNAGATFVAVLNPNSIKQTLGISYTNENNDCKSKGNTSSNTLFSGYESESLEFEILLDATGVAINTGRRKDLPVNEQLRRLKNATYAYNSKAHEPLPVEVTWGKTVCFKGRLVSMGLSYTLFDKNGVPIRATVSLKFTQFLSEKEKQARAKMSSPDLTHIVEFKAGDTLPNLCQKIYNDSSYYAEVARANNLPNVRIIAPGTQLYFPPLV